MDKKKILMLLAAVWAGQIAYRLMPNSKTAPKATILSEGRELHKLRLDLLKVKRPEYKDIKKDIFSPLKKTESKPPVPKPVFIDAVQVALTPPPTPIQVFSTQMSFVGFIEKGSGRKVFLSKGPDIFILKRGDIIEGMFSLTEINDGTIQFTDVSSGEKLLIGLEKK